MERERSSPPIEGADRRLGEAALLALADRGDLGGLLAAVASDHPELAVQAQWWQGEFHLDLVLAPRADPGPCLVVAAN